MRAFLTIVFCAALTLWLGGLVTLFLMVQALFSSNRGVAVNAAPILFRIFEGYQLILLMIALLSLVAWRLIACSRPKKWITALILLAGAMAVAQSALVSSRMRAIMPGASTTATVSEDRAAEFRRLHGYSMLLYSAQTIVLAMAACLLPRAIAVESDFTLPPRRTSPGTAPA